MSATTDHFIVTVRNFVNVVNATRCKWPDFVQAICTLEELTAYYGVVRMLEQVEAEVKK